MDRYEQREIIKENIGYEQLQQELPYDDVESLLELIVDVICSTASTMRIGGEVLPVEAVKQRFQQLDGGHIRYVVESLRQTTTKINNTSSTTAAYHSKKFTTANTSRNSTRYFSTPSNRGSKRPGPEGAGTAPAISAHEGAFLCPEKSGPG